MFFNTFYEILDDEYAFENDCIIFNEYYEFILKYYKNSLLFMLIIKHTNIKKYIPTIMAKYIIEKYIIGNITIK
jgi:hypothetical protein